MKTGAQRYTNISVDCEMGMETGLQREATEPLREVLVENDSSNMVRNSVTFQMILSLY